MSAGRPIIVAAQVIVVGVLVVIVYTNFLRPEDDSSLSGVAAPGGPEIAQGTEPSADGNTGRTGDRAGGPATAGVRPAQALATPTGVGPSAGPVSSSLDSPSGAPDSGGGGPAGDQYLDAVARLTVKLY